MMDIISDSKIDKIKQVFANILETGTTDFNYGFMVNLPTNNGVVGYQGQGKTRGLAIMDLINDVWFDLNKIEKEKIAMVLARKENN